MKTLPATVLPTRPDGNSQGDNDETLDDAPPDQDGPLAEFPELLRLVDLLRAGWQFLPFSSAGELVEVRGVRTWPDEWLDTITMRFTTDATGLRHDRFGTVVWERAGDLADVVDGLLALPAPNDPAAPRLALRTSTRLWTPAGQGLIQDAPPPVGRAAVQVLLTGPELLDSPVRHHENRY